MRLRSWLTITSLALGLLVCVTLASSTHAAPSREEVTFSCRLVSDSTPVNGNYSLTFSVWPAETGGTSVHSETQTVAVSNGLVSVTLGAQTGNEITGVFSQNDDLWISVSLGAQDLLGGRVPLRAVPYAMSSARSAGLWDSSTQTTQTLSQLDTRYVAASTSGETSDNTLISGPTVAGADLFLEAPGDGVTRGTIVVKDPISIDTHLMLKKLSTAPVGSSGYVSLYAKLDGNLYRRDGTGSEVEVGSGSGGGGGTNHLLNGLRLTVTAGAPVPTADVSSSSVLYVTPYSSNEVWTKDSGSWTRHTLSSELQANLFHFSTSANTNYDVFLSWSGSALEVGLHAWDDDTARANGSSGTDLAREDGVWVRKVAGGAAVPSDRYLGTIRTGANANSIPDTALLRFVWNAANRVPRAGASRSATFLWTTSSTSWSRFNSGDAAFKFEFVRGLDEHPIDAYLSVYTHGSGGGSYTYAGLGLDQPSSSPVPDSSLNGHASINSPAAGGDQVTTVHQFRPSPGYHFVEAFEGTGGGASTYYGGSTYSIMRLTFTN